MDKKLEIPTGILPKDKLQRADDSPLRLKAFTRFTELAETEDKEYNKFAVNPEWSSYTLKEHELYVNNPVPLSLQEICTTNLKDKIDNFFAHESSSNIGLFIQSYFQKASVLFIPTNMQSISIEQNTFDKSCSISYLIVLVEEDSTIEIKFKSTAIDAVSITHLCIVAHDSSHIKIVHSIENYANAHTLYDTFFWLHNNVSINYSDSIKGGHTFLTKSFNVTGKGSSLKNHTTANLQNNESLASFVLQYHEKPQSISTVKAHAVLHDNATSFYRGKIIIREQAAQSKAEQYQKHLIIGEQAKTCAIPSLEIKAHEVECRHGSAVSNINDEYLWYLQSRGLSRDTSQNLIIQGFLQELTL